jgi:rRNA maturation endonuclease Nob1
VGANREEMVMKQTKQSRIGEVRCHNCFVRFRPPPGAEKATCPACGFEWLISWKGKLAKIRKPVWESWEQQLAEQQQTR